MCLQSNTDMITRACNPSTQEGQKGGSEIQSHFGYTLGSRPAWTMWDPDQKRSNAIPWALHAQAHLVRDLCVPDSMLMPGQAQDAILMLLLCSQEEKGEQFKRFPFS